MNITLSHKLIQELCGMVSFKKGDAFYRANKVIIQSITPDWCEAAVLGSEVFQVTIIKTGSEGSFHSKCSCPKLASFQKECQHVAAVLHAIFERKRKEADQIHETKDQESISSRLFTIFNEKQTQSIGQQQYFENREVIKLEFIFQPVGLKNGKYLFGVEIKIAKIKAEDIRAFLEQVKKGDSFSLSNSIHYDPSLHCIQPESDGFLRQLMKVVDDEKMTSDTRMEDKTSRDILIIPPTSWERLAPLLSSTPFVTLKDGNGLIFSEGRLPLHFELSIKSDNEYRLSINGMDQLIIFDSYEAVLSDGKLFSLSHVDCERLLELQRMLLLSSSKDIPIGSEQINHFLEKVIPKLKKLGDVTLEYPIHKRFQRIPLRAKLYLDRVKNRLLASIEFHYDNLIFHPLEERASSSPLIFLRDAEKESDILKLMEDSYFTKTDGGYFLHNEELEYEFLYYTIPKLQKLVHIYATTAVRNRIFRESSPPKIRVKVQKERTNWLEFKFEMDGIRDNDIREILQALEEKQKFFRLPNGSLLSLQTREMVEIQRFLHALPIQNKDWETSLSVPIVRGLQLLDSVHQEDTFCFEESFRGFLNHFYDPNQLDIEVPSSLKTILRDYQTLGYKWLKTLASYGFGGILADDMGLGKTLQSISFIVSELPTIRQKKQPVLIVCPSSITYNWLNELKNFAPNIQANVVDGTKEMRHMLLKEIDQVDVLILSYPLLRRDIKWFEEQNFHTVFFDEAQAFKNPLTQTARAVKRIQAEHRFALTGTPIENSMEELWSIFHVVFPELLLGLKEFSHLSREKVSRRIRPFMLRRLKEDVLSELPEKIESIDSTELLSEQKKLYAAYLAKLREDTLKHLDKDTLQRNRIKILAGITRLRQICCHPALFVDGYKGSSAKFEQLLQIIEESRSSGRRVLIFSQFTKMLALIGRELTHRGYPFFYLDGQTPSDERVRTCQRFNEGERGLFLISLKAGGTGLNLTGADTVVLYDLWWNPAVEEQAADRAHRMGQTKVVHVIKLVSRGTIEEKMNELQEKKRQLVEEIIESREKGAYALTEEDIREILAL